VFVFTLIRFYVGAYRYGMETTGQPLPESVVNSTGTFLLFASFYVTSFTLREVDLFYWLVSLFLLVDFGWFFLVGAVLNVPRNMARVINIWQVFDLVTAVAVIGSILFLPEYQAQYTALSAIVGVGLLDMIWLRRFYADEPDWAKQTWGLVAAGAKLTQVAD
jgi:hypothetical protein